MEVECGTTHSATNAGISWSSVRFAPMSRDVNAALEEKSSADDDAVGGYFWQDWARRGDGVEAKSPDDVDDNLFLREWLESSDDGEAKLPDEGDRNEYFLRQWIRRRHNGDVMSGGDDVELVNDDDGPPQFELEGPDDAPRVKPFDIRPALLDVAARENTDSFDDWRRDNDGGYMAELALYDHLMTHMNSRLVPVAIDELDTDAVDVFDEAIRANLSYEAVDSQLKISCERSRKLVEKHNALVRCTVQGCCFATT